MRDFKQLANDQNTKEISEKELYEQRQILFEIELLSTPINKRSLLNNDEQLNFKKRLRRIYRLNPSK